MTFSNLVMYLPATILSTASTLFVAGRRRSISSAAQAAEALRPSLGAPPPGCLPPASSASGLLSVPIMTTGAAYDLCQVFGWKHGLNARPREAKGFYTAIAAFTVIGTGLNFLGINPMKALVWAGMVQGFSTPPLMLLLMLLTGSRAVIGGPHRPGSRLSGG